MPVSVSLIICTFNRVEYLDKAINSVMKQTLEASEYEVIVVDNGSTDGTETLVRHHSAKFAPIRYVYEPNLGLSHARNAGINSASAEICAFLDDDAIASSNWLENGLRYFDKFGVDIGLLGGKINPIWQSRKPDWLPDSMLGYYTVLQSTSRCDSTLPGCNIFGANMWLRKVAAIRAGGFPTQLGRKGNALLSKEETALRAFIEELGFISVYAPDVSVDHLIPEERLRKKWLYSRVFWNGVSDAVWWKIKERPIYRKIVTKCFKSIYVAAKAGAGCLLDIGQSHSESVTVQKRAFFFKKIGYVSGLLRSC